MLKKEINFLGTGGAFNVSQKNNCAFHKEGSRMLLIDCGESIFEEIVKKSLLKDVTDLDILITHFHSDHVGSIGSLLFYTDMLGINTNVIFPNKESMNTLLELFGVTNCNYNVLSPIEVDKYKIKEYKAKHNNMEAYSYLININDKLIYYSGDTKSIPEEVLSLLKDNKIDEFYQDIRIDSNPFHMTVNELNKMIEKEYRSRVNGMHYDETKKEIIEKSGYRLVKKI